MDINLVQKIKHLAIIALASDDALVETLVLKGGNAIELAYQPRRGATSRTSFDLDYSIDDGDFDEDEASIAQRIAHTLTQTFLEHDFIVLDYKFLSKPRRIENQLADFWGGYKVEFKVIGRGLYEAFKANPDTLRRRAVELHPNHSPVFELEFSKFEYIGRKVPIDVDGYKIYVYTPEMIVFEKLRAICQQLPFYKEVIPSFTARARARDFYDIHLIMEMYAIQPDTMEHKLLIQRIFEAKKVPLWYISAIKDFSALHVDDWQSVRDTLPPHEKLYDFDFYFDFLVQKFGHITFPGDNKSSR